MKKMELNRLNELVEKKPSTWLTKSEQRKKNKWLRYSSQIARRIFAAIDDNPEINQTLLAEKLGVKKQRISKILKGNENLTLETIYNLEVALAIPLIQFPDYKYSFTEGFNFRTEEKWQLKNFDILTCNDHFIDVKLNYVFDFKTTQELAPQSINLKSI